MSSPGEGLPPRGRPARTGVRSPSHAPTLSSGPQSQSVPGRRASLRPPPGPLLSARLPPGAWQSACRAWAPGALGRGGGARLHPGARRVRGGTGAKTLQTLRCLCSTGPLPTLGRPAEPWSPGGGRQTPAASAFALTTSQPGLVPQGAVILSSRGVRAGMERTEALEGVPRTCQATEAGAQPRADAPSNPPFTVQGLL